MKLSFRGDTHGFGASKEMATHSSTLAWKIPWTEEPGGLQSTGSLESDTTERLHSLTHSGGTSGKEPACQCRRRKRRQFNPWVRKIPWRRAWQPTQVFLPGESHGQRSLVGYRPWHYKELDMTKGT